MIMMIRDRRKDKKCEIKNVKFIGNQNSY